MRKKDILYKLRKEYELAKKRQLPNATKESGHMRGLMKAIQIIESY